MIDFAAVLRTLSEAGVQFIIVGGAAATAHGSARLTQDLDLVYRRDEENLRRLALALEPQHPYFPIQGPSVEEADPLLRARVPRGGRSRREGLSDLGGPL